jgi:hypothetical protein
VLNLSPWVEKLNEIIDVQVGNTDILPQSFPVIFQQISNTIETVVITEQPFLSMFLQGFKAAKEKHPPKMLSGNCQTASPPSESATPLGLDLAWIG